MGKVRGELADELILFVRQTAWLHAVPRPDADSGRGQSEAAAKNKTSRLAAMARDDIVPRMPPNPGSHITEWLADLGYVEAGGYGPTVLSWREIDAWQRSTQTRLTRWEGSLIRRLSSAYLSESREAESENRPAPWHDGPDAKMVQTEQSRLIALLGE